MEIVVLELWALRMILTTRYERDVERVDRNYAVRTPILPPKVIVGIDQTSMML